MFVPPEKGDEHTDGPATAPPSHKSVPIRQTAAPSSLPAASPWMAAWLSTGDDAQVFILADYQVTGNGQNRSNLLVSAPSAE
jgi:hypothetical protein